MPFTVKTLYWAAYGYTPPNFNDIIIREHVEKQENSTVIIYNEHQTTELVGYFLFGFYCIFGVIVLINMFVGLMSSTFMAVVEHADTEWKFARTRVWMKYLQLGDFLPPPFNLVPCRKRLRHCVNWLSNKLQGKDNSSISCDICHFPESEDEKIDKDTCYETLTGLLVRRYVSLKVPNPCYMPENTEVQQEVLDLKKSIQQLADSVELVDGVPSLVITSSLVESLPSWPAIAKLRKIPEKAPEYVVSEPNAEWKSPKRRHPWK